MELKKGQLEQEAPCLNQDEPKTIAEFNITSNHEMRIQEIVEEYSTCYLCGSDLIFTQMANYMNNEIEEESMCPSCNMKNNKETHRLH